MTTRMTINGVSTCAEAGTEKYERFQSGIGRRRRTLVPVSYTHLDVYKRQMPQLMQRSWLMTALPARLNSMAFFGQLVAQARACLLYTSRCV